MLSWAVTFFIIALIAAVLGFSGTPVQRSISPGFSPSSGSFSLLSLACWDAGYNFGEQRVRRVSPADQTITSMPLERVVPSEALCRGLFLCLERLT